MSVEKKDLGVLDGKSVRLYTISNRSGASVGISEFGGSMVFLCVPDRNGQTADVVLGYDTLAEYAADDWFLGCTIGRVSGRIRDGLLRIDGKEYQLSRNFGGHHIHGGTHGFFKAVWAGEVPDAAGNTVVLHYTSPDGEENYPGRLAVRVRYTLSDENTLSVVYDAVGDRNTAVSLSNHSYFNLSGGSKSDIREHVLQIFAERYTPADCELLPTGAIDPVAGTALDYTVSRPLGETMSRAIAAGEAQVAMFGGIDHNFVLTPAPGLKRALALYDPGSGRHLEIYTTLPGLQVYTANRWTGLRGKNGALYGNWAGIALEPQFFPDALNHPSFPSPLLKAGEAYHHEIQYRFTAQ